MELLLNGYLTRDFDDHPALSNSKEDEKIYAKSIPQEIQRGFGEQQYDNEYLGGELSEIPDCCLSIWFTDDKCTFDEAQESLCNYLDGCMTVDISYLGYSEWTITGFNLDEFTIGEHDLDKELEDHMGQYCWIRITGDRYNEN
jgi:hypothetical protein